MSLPGGPVFPVAHLPSAPLIGGQDGEFVFHADFVADLPELPQSGGCLAELHPSFKADGVDYEVGVDMPGIAVGSHLHLMPRPGLGGELQTDCVGLFIGDVLVG